MTSGETKHHARKVSLRDFCDTVVAGKGGTQVVVNVLQRSGTSRNNFWL